MPVMDVAAAKRDGYSDEEILTELQKRSGVKMDIQSARADGYTVEEIAQEVDRRVGQAPRKSGAEARARARKIETGSTPDDLLSQGLAFGRDVVGTVGGATAALTENVGRAAGLLPGIDSDNFVSRSGKE